MIFVIHPILLLPLAAPGFDRIVVVVVIIISTGSNVGLTTSLAEMRLIYEVQNRLN